MYEEERYEPFIERNWLKTYWAAGLPQHDPNMHYYLNCFHTPAVESAPKPRLSTWGDRRPFMFSCARYGSAERRPPAAVLSTRYRTIH